MKHSFPIFQRKFLLYLSLLFLLLYSSPHSTASPLLSSCSWLRVSLNPQTPTSFFPSPSHTTPDLILPVTDTLRLHCPKKVASSIPTKLCYKFPAAEARGHFSYLNISIKGAENQCLMQLPPTSWTVMGGDFAKIVLIPEGTSHIDVQSFIRNIQFFLPTDSQAEVSIRADSQSDLDSTYFYFPDNDHFYRFVPFTEEDRDLTWIDCYHRARNLQVMGRQGYLATITSYEEDVYIVEHLDYTCWLGGTRLAPMGEDGQMYYVDFDRSTLIADSSSSGHWYWACGPERGDTLFSAVSCSDYMRRNGIATAAEAYARQRNEGRPVYAHWRQADVEPNNNGNNEQCLVLRTPHKARVWSRSSWDDRLYRYNSIVWNSFYNAHGYLVEFGNRTVGDTSTVMSHARFADTEWIGAVEPPQANDDLYAKSSQRQGVMFLDVLENDELTNVNFDVEVLTLPQEASLHWNEEKKVFEYQPNTSDNNDMFCYVLSTCKGKDTARVSITKTALQLGCPEELPDNHFAFTHAEVKGCVRTVTVRYPNVVTDSEILLSAPSTWNLSGSATHKFIQVPENTPIDLVQTLLRNMSFKVPARDLREVTITLGSEYVDGDLFYNDRNDCYYAYVSLETENQRISPNHITAKEVYDRASQSTYMGRSGCLVAVVSTAESAYGSFAWREQTSSNCLSISSPLLHNDIPLRGYWVAYESTHLEDSTELKSLEITAIERVGSGKDTASVRLYTHQNTTVSRGEAFVLRLDWKANAPYNCVIEGSDGSRYSVQDCDSLVIYPNQSAIYTITEMSDQPTEACRTHAYKMLGEVAITVPIVEEIPIVIMDTTKVYDATPLTPRVFSIEQGLQHITYAYSRDSIHWSSTPVSITTVGRHRCYVRVSAEGYLTTTIPYTLSITPAPVVVEVQGHVRDACSGAHPIRVSGYDLTFSSPLYQRTDFTFTGDSLLSASLPSTYTMNLQASQFVNNNPNFAPQFHIVRDGALTISQTPIVADTSLTILCGSGSLDLLPIHGQGGNIIPADTRYSWLVDDNPHIAGEAISLMPQTSVALSLQNHASTSQAVTYWVTPATDICVGQPFTLTVEVRPASYFQVIPPADIDMMLQYGQCDTLLTSLGTPTVLGISYDLGTITALVPSGGLFSLKDCAKDDTLFRVRYTAIDGCGVTDTAYQSVHISFPPCGDGYTVTDIDGHVYPTVRIDCECWTKENMKTKHYADGRAVEFAKVHRSEGFPDTLFNAETFGLLYSWFAVMALPEGSTEEPLTDYTDGRVRGICPAGWYVPTQEQYENLLKYPILSLKSEEYWLMTRGTNETGFTALPAGWYDTGEGIYIKICAEARFWSSSIHSSGMALYMDLYYYCDKMMAPSHKSHGYSVRCIKHR